jgi:hypothetical protein
VKQRFIREGAGLPDDVTIVVRGGELDRAILREDARRNHAIYGTYGLSVFAVRGITLDELAQQSPLVRFARLTLMTVGAIRAARLRLEPTGRNPRHYDICFDELEPGITRLLACDHTVWINPYHEP